jgi:hypothetical protein
MSRTIKRALGAALLATLLASCGATSAVRPVRDAAPFSACDSLVSTMVETGDYPGGPLAHACVGAEDSESVDALMAVAADYSVGRATLTDPRIAAILGAP